METGSSRPVSGACASTDSLHGLAFGKKIYFEDGTAAGGGGGGGGGISSKASAESPAAKRGRGVAQQQPPRCQVEGCKADLTGAKAYYCRHKVCAMHSKSPRVIVAGLEQRFCQQCSRFHQLDEFDQGKRSCRRRLAGHNERRRKPPGVPLSSSRYEDNRFRSFLMDFTRPMPPYTASRNAWPTVRASERVPSNQWQGGFEGPSGGAVAHGASPFMQGGNLFNALEIPPPVEGGAGVCDSNCALSLLSARPWGNFTSNRAPTISTSSCFEVAPVAQPVIANNSMTNYWSFRGHEADNSSHGIQHKIGFGQAVEAGIGQFSDELELALQGSGQCQDICPGRACNLPGHVMHWSL